MIAQPQTIRSDVLVLGGAITGMFAAIRIKELAPEKTVIVVDKGKAGRTGQAHWGGGDITYVTPEDNMEALSERYLKSGQGLADPHWLRMALEETYDHVRRLASWGVPFERDEKGDILRKAGRGGGALAAVCQGSLMLKYIRRLALKRGVKFIDRVMVTDLLTNDQGLVQGAVGFAIGVEEVQPVMFMASATVLVTGPCSFKATYIGSRFSTGDGLGMAFRQGAEFTGMEFACTHNSGPRDFDLSGMARFVAMGGKFLNRLGEEYMLRYDPELGNRANHSETIFAMAQEMRAGRGPIYFDMTSISDADLELSRKILPFTFLALERSGLDFRRHRIEWIPCLGGNRAGGAGLVIDQGMATTLPGLFTGGDTGCKYHYGANGGYHGMNFGWCTISGWRAGASALQFSQEENSEVRPAVWQDSLEYQHRPLNVTGNAITPQEAIAWVQEAIVPYDVIILKQENRLKTALSKLGELVRNLDNICAANSHELMKAHEAKNMALTAWMVLGASLVRQESRGLHHREDFPERNDQEWGKHLRLWQEGSQIACQLEGSEKKQYIAV